MTARRTLSRVSGSRGIDSKLKRDAKRAAASWKQAQRKASREKLGRLRGRVVTEQTAKRYRAAVKELFTWQQRERRRRAANIKVREIIKSFIGEADVEGVRGDDEPEHNRQATDDDEDCELFWANLPVEVSRERHILNIPTRPERCYPGRAVKSREVMLG